MSQNGSPVDGSLTSSPLDLPAHEQATQLRAGDITARGLAELAFARVRAQEPALNAYITLIEDEALAQADAADARLRSGEAAPLTGIPIGVKDLLSTRGVATTAASRMLDGFRPIVDSTVVAKLREAGAVFVGKTNLDEFAMGSSTEHSAFGPTHNPWDLERVPGGSSGGSAATVAARRRAALARHRHRRLDPPAGRPLRHPRPEAHVRARQPLRCRRLRFLARAGRPLRA